MRTRRHDSVKRALVAMLRTAGEVPVEEDVVTLPGVRMDVKIHFRMQDSQNRAIDASVVNPTPPMGQTIAQREREKTQALALSTW